MTIAFLVPIETKNTSNLREHHFVRAKRLAKERKAAMALCPRYRGPPLLVVTLVRVGPRTLDDDGLRSALKAVRDGVASRLGVDDGSQLVAWRYGQERGEPGVRVTISRGEQPPG